MKQQIAIVFAVLTLAAVPGGVCAEHENNPADGVRVAVNNVLDDGGAIVAQVMIVTQPGALLKVVCDKPKRGGLETRSGGLPNATLAEAELILFGDQIDEGPGRVKQFKFMMRLKTTVASASMSQAGAPPRGKQLRDLLSVKVKTGFYPYEQAIKLLTLDDRTYSLIAERPK